MSLSCALWATSLNQWARRYIRLTQPARRSPEKQARIRAFYSNGVDKMHIPWAVEGLPTLLHLSLFLFFGGLVIFLFNVDREVFTCVVSWIGFFSIVYGLITILPLIRPDSPYHAPLSAPAWFLYAGIQYVIFKVLTSIFYYVNCSFDIWERCFNLRNRFSGWMLGGVEKKAEETALERSSEFDIQILEWTIGALGNDDSLEKFFETIPGLFNSKLAKDLERHFSMRLLKNFWRTMDGLMGRTFSSNSVTESVKSRRIFICRDIMNMIPCATFNALDNLHSHFIQAPVSMEKLQTMAQWFTHASRDVSYAARAKVARNLPRIQERDNRWIALASAVYGLSERTSDLRRNVTFSGDDVLLATLIDFSRRANIHQEFRLVQALTQFDMRNTLPGLQHDFCTLWNELVQGAQNTGYHTHFIDILRQTRHHYITLHQGTEAAPTSFTPSTDYFDDILLLPSSFPSCNIASHRPNSTPYIAVPLLIEPGYSSNAVSYYLTYGGSNVSQQVEEPSMLAAGHPPLSNPITPGETGDSCQPPVATSLTLLAHTNTDALTPGVVAVALQDIPTAVALSHPPEGSAQRDMISPRAGPDICEILSTAPMSAPSPSLAPAFTSRGLDKPSASSDAGPASVSNPLLPLSVVGFSVPTPPLLSRVPPSSNVESLVHLRSTMPSRANGNTALTRLRARGLVNIGNMCSVNAVLQLLVHSPPFLDLFRELGDLNGQRGAGGTETSGGATPLVDATLRFIEEFVSNEKELPSTQQPPLHVETGKPGEDPESKKENKVVDSFEPTYMYKAMKEKGQLERFLVRSRD